MSQIIYGDLNVKRTLNADRRVNQGLSRETITSLRNVVVNDYAWLQITNASTQDVVMPDATTLANGWSIVVMADAASGASVNVKSYHAVTPVLIKNILVGRAYRFSLVDGTASAGVWHIDFLEEADLIASARYVGSFNATSDWGSPSGGYYTYTLAQSTHLRGTSPSVSLLLGPAPYSRVGCDLLTIAANGDVAIRVPQVPDLRFAGEMILI